MLGLAFLFVSSVIGAGFVTGAELVIFFGNSPLPPALIATLVGVTIFVFLSMLIYVDKKNFTPPRVVFVPLYFAFFVIMTAGLMTLAGVWVAILCLAMCVVIVMSGFEKIVGYNKYIIAFVLVVVLFVTLQNGSPESHPPPQGVSTPRTLYNVVIYAGMNMMLFPVVRRARKNHSTKKILGAAAISAATLGLLVFVLMNATAGHSNLAMPILGLADNFWVRSAIFLSMFTSQFIGLFNIEAGIGKKTKGNQRALLLVLICATAFVFSLGGFTQLMSVVYPAIGLFMVVFLSCAFAWCYFFSRTRQHQVPPLDQHAPPLS